MRKGPPVSVSPRVSAGRAFAGPVAAALLVTAGCATAPAPTPVSREPAAAAPAAERSTPPVPDQPKAIKVKIGMANDSLTFGPVYLAVRKGFFREAGLEVERTTLQGGTALMPAFLAGEIDLAATASDPVIELRSGGKDALTVYAITSQHAWHLLVGQKFAEQRSIDPRAPLQEKVSRLKGITLGAPSLGGTTEFFTRYIMRKGGLKDDEVNVVTAGSSTAQIAAVEKGQIDGFVNAPPSPQEAARRGQALILVRPGEIPEFADTIFGIMMARQAYAEQNPEVVKRVAQALDRAKRYMREDFEGAAQALMQDFRGVEADAMRESLRFYAEAYRGDGRMTPAVWKTALELIQAGSQDKYKAGSLSAAEGVYWTNKFLP